MTSTHRPFIALAVAAALTISMSSCGSPTPEENTAAACDAYAALASAVSDARTSLSADSTIDEIAEKRDAINKAYEDLEGALGDVGEDRQEAVKEAWESFNDKVDEVEGDSTVPQAIESLTSSIQQIQDAQTALNEDLTC